MTNTRNDTNTAKDERYNGWTNYETWAVALWIDDEQSNNILWRSEAARHTDEATYDKMFFDIACTAHETVRNSLAIQLRNEATKAVHDVESPFYSDLLLMAFDRVNWLEIAENLLVDLVA